MSWLNNVKSFTQYSYIFSCFDYRSLLIFVVWRKAHLTFNLLIIILAYKYFCFVASLGNEISLLLTLLLFSNISSHISKHNLDIISNCEGTSPKRGPLLY